MDLVGLGKEAGGKCDRFPEGKSVRRDGGRRESAMSEDKAELYGKWRRRVEVAGDKRAGRELERQARQARQGPLRALGRGIHCCGAIRGTSRSTRSTPDSALCPSSLESGVSTLPGVASNIPFRTRLASPMPSHPPPRQHKWLACTCAALSLSCHVVQSARVPDRARQYELWPATVGFQHDDRGNHRAQEQWGFRAGTCLVQSSWGKCLEAVERLGCHMLTGGILARGPGLGFIHRPIILHR